LDDDDCGLENLQRRLEMTLAVVQHRLRRLARLTFPPDVRRTASG
jgi:hypothetical protein